MVGSGVLSEQFSYVGPWRTEPSFTQTCHSHAAVGCQNSQSNSWCVCPISLMANPSFFPLARQPDTTRPMHDDGCGKLRVFLLHSLRG